MKDYKTKLESLHESSVWIFTKQNAAFDVAYKAVKMLFEMPEKLNVSFEEYFEDKHVEYDIPTSRHRVLIMAQMFGLLTKKHFYKGGGRYEEEEPTDVFKSINTYEIGSYEFNTIKTEQILKFKIRSITDTKGNNNEYKILPLIFTYKVLKDLKDTYGIKEVSLDDFYTYIATCENFSDINETVNILSDNARSHTKYLETYKSRARVIKLFKKNVNLFNITDKYISINADFDNYFNERFINNFDLNQIVKQIQTDSTYSDFLTSCQHFNVNLIDIPNTLYDEMPLIGEFNAPYSYDSTSAPSIEFDDSYYINNVNSFNEVDIDPYVIKNASKLQPALGKATTSQRHKKNSMIGKFAIKEAKYLCENNSEHSTFTSNTSNNQYMEAHHFIPVSYQEEMWSKFEVNIDCVENIVSLCPNCHRAIHYATPKEKIKIIEKLFEIKISELSKLGIDLTLSEIKELYIKM